MHNAKVLHDDRCQDRVGELMAGDDDQRQVERVSGVAEVAIPCPEAGEEVDVGEPTVVEDQQSDPQSVPQSVSQPGVGSRASETNTDDREVKRVRIAESRGQ